MPKVSRDNAFLFLRFALVRYVTYLFTDIQKQQNMSQIRLNFNAKFLGYCFCLNTNI